MQRNLIFLKNFKHTMDDILAIRSSPDKFLQRCLLASFAISIIFSFCLQCCMLLIIIDKVSSFASKSSTSFSSKSAQSEKGFVVAIDILRQGVCCDDGGTLLEPWLPSDEASGNNS